MLENFKIWLSKHCVILVAMLSLLFFIINQVIDGSKYFLENFKFYHVYLSSAVSVITSGIFIALFVYCFTVTVPERKRDKFILEYILKQYQLMKDQIWSEILIIIDEQGGEGVRKLSRDVVEAKIFLNAGEGDQKSYRWYRLCNELSTSNYRDINIHLQNFAQVLRLFSNTQTALNYDMVPILIRFIKAINFNNHYVENGREMGGDQYRPFLTSLYSIFTGFNLIDGDTGEDYFVTQMNHILKKL